MAREQQTTERNGERREESTSLSGKTHEVAEQAKQAALERVDAVRQTTQTAREQTAERVRKLGAAVRKVGEHLRVEDQHYIADRANDASQRLENFASYINDAEIATLLRDTGELARRKPSVFFGSAFVLGLAAGRFLRSGSSTTARPAASQSMPEAGAQMATPPATGSQKPQTSKPNPAPRSGTSTRTGVSQ
ncbi:MAG TPA: hypothetical protein VJR89_22090 [Polyangiales bacterium]|nr:hypothetical protein [Polyangiales bacterium]